MYIHHYIVYNTLRDKDIVKIKSEYKEACIYRDSEKINEQTKFYKHQVAYVGHIETKEEENAGQNTPADNSGSQRPTNNKIKTYITWI